MEASQVEGILKVHREGGTLSAEAILDEGIREVGAMEQVSCCDPNGKGRPSTETWVLGWQVVGRFCGKMEECWFVGCSDILEPGGRGR